MTDDLDNEKMEDEYEFSGEEEYTSPEFEDVGGPEVDLNAEPEADVEASGMDEIVEGPSPMRKILGYVAIGVGTVLVALYMGRGGDSDSEQQGLPDTTAVQVPPVKAPAPVAKAPEPAPTPAPVVTSAPSVGLSEQEKQALSQMSDQVRTNSLTVENLGVRVQSLESSVKKIGDTVDRIDKKLSPSMKPTSKPVAKKKAYKPKKVARKPVFRKLFGLKAVVPGRAWVQTASGQMLSVSVGDSIYGLGRVKAIDAPEGRVVTSSGAVIVYGPGDS